MTQLNEKIATTHPFELVAAVPVSATVSVLSEQIVEGGVDPVIGDVTWRTLISSEKTPTTELVLGVAEFSPNGVLHLHRHLPAEFYFCLSGEGVVAIDGVAHSIAAGAAVYIPANAEHGVVAGVNGLSIVYGFPEDSFAKINYEFSAPDAGSGVLLPWVLNT